MKLSNNQAAKRTRVPRRSVAKSRRRSLAAGFEQLDSRNLMAADFGIGMDMPMGPLAQPAAEIGMAIPTANSGTQQNAAGDFELPLIQAELVGGNLQIIGTEFHDSVSIDYDAGLVKVTAATTDDAGLELSSFTKYFYFGSFNAVDFVGGDGDDFLDNGINKPTTFQGGEGNDIAYGSSTQSNFLIGQGGDDKLYGGNVFDYIEGGSGDDVVAGRGGDDILNGGADDDRMYGNGGDDTMNGGSGNDSMHGSSGDDEMRGGSGEDLVSGGIGQDTMFGGADNDRMYGGSHDDIMMGEGGVDRMWGGNGNDMMDGGADSDFLYGQWGNDQLFGRSGIDWLAGGDGNDILDGGDDMSVDHLEGNAGDDLFIRHKHWGSDDPDVFADYNGSDDDIDNDWWGSNFGNNFPTP